MTPEEEFLWRQREHEMASLRWHWDGAYEFSQTLDAYSAKRADNGAVITGTDLPAFREAVRMDYCHRPVAQPRRI